MTAKRFYSFGNVMNDIIEKVSESDSAECKNYINETIIKCGELCKKGEEVRALNEIKRMCVNLKKKYDV